MLLRCPADSISQPQGEEGSVINVSSTEKFFSRFTKTFQLFFFFFKLCVSLAACALWQSVLNILNCIAISLGTGDTVAILKDSLF